MLHSTTKYQGYLTEIQAIYKPNPCNTQAILGKYKFYAM
jgi:hypothetical protein